MADVAGAEPEPDAEAPARRAPEIAVRARSPLGAGTVHPKSLVREALGIGQSEASTAEVVERNVTRERRHVATRRTDVIAREESARLCRQNEDVSGGLRVEQEERLLGCAEELLVLRTNLPLGVVVEARGNLLEHVEQVTHGDVERLPACRRLLDEPNDRLELGEDDETAVHALGEHETATAVRLGAVVAHVLARPVAHVVALDERLDVREVESGEVELQDRSAIERGLGLPTRRIHAVRTLGALGRVRTGVARVHDHDPVSLLLRGFGHHSLVHELTDERGVAGTTQPGRVIGRPASLIRNDVDDGRELGECNLLERRCHVALPFLAVMHVSRVDGTTRRCGICLLKTALLKPII